MSPKNEYFGTTPKNGSAQECGIKGRPHGNISARKSNISAQNPKNAFFLHGEVRNLPPIIQHVDFSPFLAVQNSSIGLIVPLSDPTNNQSLHNTTE